jgi:integration host factor subunit beta
VKGGVCFKASGLAIKNNQMDAHLCGQRYFHSGPLSGDDASAFPPHKACATPSSSLVKIIEMTRSELITVLAQRFPQLLRVDTEMAVTEILRALAGTLHRGHRVEIRGFGAFDLNYRSPRNARNPKTGEKVSVPGKCVPHFKAGKELRESVNGC